MGGGPWRGCLRRIPRSSPEVVPSSRLRPVARSTRICRAAALPDLPPTGRRMCGRGLARSGGLPSADSPLVMPGDQPQRRRHRTDDQKEVHEKDRQCCRESHLAPRGVPDGQDGAQNAQNEGRQDGELQSLWEKRVRVHQVLTNLHAPSRASIAPPAHCHRRRALWALWPSGTAC